MRSTRNPQGGPVPQSQENTPTQSNRPDSAVGGVPRRTVIGDDDLKRMLSQNKPSFLQRNAGCMVTLVLIALNVAVYAVEVLLSGMRVDVSTQVLVEMGAMYAPLVRSAADLYRFVTPMFLHMDLMHLAFNMVALYSVGEVLERTLGKGWFVALYFVGGITGNAVSYAADVFLGSGASVSAGASTSVFGLFVAVALLGVLHRGNRSVFAQYSKGMLGVIAVNVAYTLLVPGISVSGHLGGALGGAAAMLMLPARSLRVPVVVRVVVAVAWAGALGWLLVSRGLIG
ncbi:MAG TPA: rhomboid family intramembrane serine protease [Candidatus Rubneribacter avistercoris]|nr:rhomboid family intramembrane serine protease [Candidatus Rubneribacter avistercoris]